MFQTNRLSDKLKELLEILFATKNHSKIIQPLAIMMMQYSYTLQRSPPTCQRKERHQFSTMAKQRVAPVLQHFNIERVSSPPVLQLVQVERGSSQNVKIARSSSPPILQHVNQREVQVLLHARVKRCSSPSNQRETPVLQHVKAEIGSSPPVHPTWSNRERLSHPKCQIIKT